MQSALGAIKCNVLSYRSARGLKTKTHAKQTIFPPVSDNTAELLPLFNTPKAFQQRLVIGVCGNCACSFGTQKQEKRGLFERQAQRVGVREHRQFLILWKRCCRPLSISVKWRQDQLSRKMPSDLLVWIFTNLQNLLKLWLFFFTQRNSNKTL